MKVGLAFVCGFVTQLICAQESETSVWEGAYTLPQAQRGADVYARSCVSCHATEAGVVAGHGPAPSVVGEDFMFRWTDASIADLFDTVRQTMPEAAPNSLSAQEYADVVAYLLNLNGFPSSNDRSLDPKARGAMLNTYIEPRAEGG